MKHDGVQFLFLTSTAGEKPEVPTGVVIERAGQMVLEFSDSEERYTVVGRATGHFFTGEHSSRDPSRNAQAVWCNMNGECIGRWRENGTDYLFSFSLQLAST